MGIASIVEAMKIVAQGLSMWNISSQHLTREQTMWKTLLIRAMVATAINLPRYLHLTQFQNKQWRYSIHEPKFGMNIFVGMKLQLSFWVTRQQAEQPSRL